MNEEHSANEQRDQPQAEQKPQGQQEQGQQEQSKQPETSADTATADTSTSDAAPSGTTTPGTLFGSDEMEGMKSEETKKKEEEEKKRKEAAKNSGSDKKYPEGTEFRYSGHTKVLQEEMSEAEIFKWIADEFPEIEAGKWTLRYDSTRGRLVPIPPAQKKGVSAEAASEEATVSSAPCSYQVLTVPPESARPPVYRLLCVDGVYEVRSNLSGTYVARLDSGLTLAEGYYPSVPKIPATLLAEVVRIFGERSDSEALIDIVYDRARERFHLVWNQNRASAGEVEYQPLPDGESLVLCAEIHSHHRMPAFFSPKDDTAEVKAGVYGVVGRIEDDVPEAAFRYSCGGHFRELLAEEIFDDPSKVAATVRRPAL